MPGFPTAIVAAAINLLCTEANCVELVGFYQGEEVARVGNHEVTQSGEEQQVLELPAPPEGVPHYDSFALVPHGQFWIHHWGLLIVDP